MTLIKTKPTSPGRRFVLNIKTDNLHKGKPHKPLVSGAKKSGGRNNYGRMTTRHQGGGHKRLYRIIDFKRNKDDIQGRIERIEYDPIEVPILHWFYIKMEQEDTLLLQKNSVLETILSLEIKYLYLLATACFY